MFDVFPFWLRGSFKFGKDCKTYVDMPLLSKLARSFWVCLVAWEIWQSLCEDWHDLVWANMWCAVVVVVVVVVVIKNYNTITMFSWRIATLPVLDPSPFFAKYGATYLNSFVFAEKYDPATPIGQNWWATRRGRNACPDNEPDARQGGQPERRATEKKTNISSAHIHFRFVDRSSKIDFEKSLRMCPSVSTLRHVPRELI